MDIGWLLAPYSGAFAGATMGTLYDPASRLPPAVVLIASLSALSWMIVIVVVTALV